MSAAVKGHLRKLQLLLAFTTLACAIRNLMLRGEVLRERQRSASGASVEQVGEDHDSNETSGDPAPVPADGGDLQEALATKHQWEHLHVNAQGQSVRNHSAAPDAAGADAEPKRFCVPESMSKEILCAALLVTSCMICGTNRLALIMQVAATVAGARAFSFADPGNQQCAEAGRSSLADIALATLLTNVAVSAVVVLLDLCHGAGSPYQELNLAVMDT